MTTDTETDYGLPAVRVDDLIPYMRRAVAERTLNTLAEITPEELAALIDVLGNWYDDEVDRWAASVPAEHLLAAMTLHQARLEHDLERNDQRPMHTSRSEIEAARQILGDLRAPSEDEDIDAIAALIERRNARETRDATSPEPPFDPHIMPIASAEYGDLPPDAMDRLERIEQETPNAFELTYRVVQFGDGSRLMAIPAELDDDVVIDMAESLVPQD